MEDKYKLKKETYFHQAFGNKNILPYIKNKYHKYKEKEAIF